MNLAPSRSSSSRRMREISAGPALLANTALAYGFHKRQRAAVENGQLQVIQLHDGIVDAAPNQGGEQMLGGGNEHALFHQTGGITHPGYVLAHGLQFKAVQVGAPKDHARSRGRGQDPQLDRRAAMQSRAAAVYRCANCLFVNQMESTISV